MTKRTRRLRLLGTLAGAGLLGWAAWTNRRLLLVADVTTGESLAYPRLRSRVYYAAPDAVLSAARLAVEGLAGWRVQNVDANSTVLDAAAPGLLPGQECEVSVYAIDLGRGQTRATIRSHARGGRGDLGQNARHIARLQEDMDSRLTGDAAF